MAKLKTTIDVIDFLGGNDSVAGMLDTNYKAVANWRYSGEFPANTFTALRAALRARRATAPVSLWSMKPLIKQQQRRA